VTATVVEITARGEATSCVLEGELIVPRLIRRRGRSVHVALVAGRAMLMPGDRVDLRIRVGDGCSLRLEDIGGLVVYGRPGGDTASAWHADLRLGAESVLIWDGLPTVITDAGALERRTTIRLGPRAGVLLRETLVLGRTGERGGRLASETDAADAAGPLLRETLHVDGGAPVPGVLGDQRVVDSILALGEHVPVPSVDGATRLDLERGGAVLRHLGSHAHASPLEGLDLTGVAARVPASDAGREPAAAMPG